MTDQQPILEVRGVKKAFGGVQALRGVSFSLHRGEVLGLLGDNGAGKSTMVNILAGSYPADEGEILIDGAPVQIDNAHRARELGIETVYQDLALVETQNVVANLFMNREIVSSKPVLRQLGWLDRKGMQQEAKRVLEGLGVRVKGYDQPVSELSGGQRQGIAVGRAVAWGREVVLLDEPSAALGVEQSRGILELIERLRDSGLAVLLISHNMQEVLEACDRAVVLRHGAKAADITVEGLTARHLVDLITGVAPATAEVAS
jgi:simple sugar transport system ATP-binding protein